MSRSAEETAKLKSEYAAWLALTPRDRRRLNLPVTKNDWAKSKGVSDRTLRNWQSEPEISAAVAAEIGEPELPQAEKVDSGGLLEQDYAEARQILMEKMRDGQNPQWAKLWWDTFGKRIAEAEAAAEQSDFANLSDLDLNQQLVDLVPAEFLAAHLREQGWTVTGPMPADPDPDGPGA